MDSSRQEIVMISKEAILNDKHRIRAAVLEGNAGGTRGPIKVLVALPADIKARVHTVSQLNKQERGVMANRKEAVRRVAHNRLHHKPTASNDKVQEQATVQRVDRTTGNNRRDINSPTLSEPAAMEANHKE